MHLQVTFEAKGVLLKGEISCKFSNCIHFQYYDASKTILQSGYKSHFLGIDEYPEIRISERGVEEILEMFELLFKLKPTLKEVGNVVTQPNDLAEFARWRDFLQNPAKYEKQPLRFDIPVEPVQLTLF